MVDRYQIKVKYFNLSFNLNLRIIFIVNKFVSKFKQVVLIEKN